MKDGVEEPLGKWPTALGNVAVLEAKHLPSLLRELLPPNAVISLLLTSLQVSYFDSTLLLASHVYNVIVSRAFLF